MKCGPPKHGIKPITGSRESEGGGLLFSGGDVCVFVTTQASKNSLYRNSKGMKQNEIPFCKRGKKNLKCKSCC